MKKLLIKLCFILTILLCYNSYAQPPDFTLNVTATSQTCLGNGSLSFTVTGNNPSAAMSYAVYFLPNTTTPVTTVTTPVATSLVAGTYQVVATQSLSGQSNTSMATAIIQDDVQPLTYTLIDSACGNNGTITVNVISGTAVFYEIIAGPQTRPLQSSNIFENLPLGFYNVRVHDSCGDAVVVTINLQVMPAEIFVGLSNIPNISLPACDKITIGNYLNNNLPMMWPVTMTLTVYPPDNSPNVVVTKIINNYSPDWIDYIDIPFYYDQSYTYDIKVTDNCGNTETGTGYMPNLKFDFELFSRSLNCNDFTLAIEEMSVYKTPCTVSFISAPAGFNPSLFNASHPTFNTNNIVYGSNSNPIPFGNYTVKITDACGHSATKSIIVTNEGNPIVKSGLGDQSLCYGYFQITIPFNRTIISAVVVSAPDNYSGTLPDDILEFASGDILFVDNVPAGSYEVRLTDSCGHEYIVNFEIIKGSNTELQIDLLPGCAENEGSVFIGNYGRRITEVIITSAPSSFQNTLPSNVSSNIGESGFSMGELPGGSYEITVTDDCGNVIQTEFTIVPYQVISNDIQVIPSCNSFKIDMNYVANNDPNFVEKFWLQKYDENIGAWTNPENGIPYEEGTIIYNYNAVEVLNNADNLYTYSGKFRIMRVLGSFSSPGSDGVYVKYCIANMYEFNYYNKPHINGAYGFSCDNGTTDVILDAEGMAPLQYEITSKNGEPFALNNGTSNIFQGLENGTYSFRVTDGCSGLLNIQYDVTLLEPFTILSEKFCDGKSSTLSVKEFPFLTYEWSKEDDVTNILSTLSSLTISSFDSDTDSGNYIVHVKATTPGSCIDIELEHEVIPIALPNAGADNAISLCNDGVNIDLNQYLLAPFDLGGTWNDIDNSGALNGNMLTTLKLLPGVYKFSYIVSNECNITDEALFTLIFKSQPEKPVINPLASVCTGSSIQLSVLAVEGASYLWTGPNGFTSTLQNPLIENAVLENGGAYSVTIKTADTECVSLPASVNAVVMDIPKFIVEGNATLCNGGSTVLFVKPENFKTSEVLYTWYQNGTIMPGHATSSIEVVEEGTYKVVVDNKGCTAVFETSVLYIYNFDIEVLAGCVNNKYILRLTDDKGFEDAVVVWKGPQGYNFEGPEADVTNGPDGEYTVIVTGVEGCVSQESILVETTSCFIPKGISPNADGKNDTFDLSGLNVSNLKIFNRYGLKIYEAMNYKDDWHGQSKGGDAPTGTYYYVITFSGGTQITGWVYVQREIK